MQISNTADPRDPYQVFLASLNKSKVTRKTYIYGLGRFLSHNQLTYKELVKKKPKSLEDMIVRYIHEMSTSLSARSIRSHLSAVKKFLDRNRVALNWDYILDDMPDVQDTVNDRSYTREEIARILDKATDTRMKCVVLIMASSGVRLGSLPTMKLGDIKKIMVDSSENILVYRLTVYAGTKDQYVTFVTPEAARMIDLYLRERQKDGEELTASSPLIRQMYGKESADKPKFIALKTLGNNILALLEKAQLRENTVDGKRYEVMASHGLRKFCDGAMIMSHVNLAVKERLLGHTTGLDDSYFKPTEEYLLNEYLKAVDLLTISKEKHLQQQVEKLQTEVADIDLMKRNYLDMKLELQREREERARLMEQLYTQGIIKKD